MRDFPCLREGKIRLADLYLELCCVIREERYLTVQYIEQQHTQAPHISRHSLVRILGLVNFGCHIGRGPNLVFELCGGPKLL